MAVGWGIVGLGNHALKLVPGLSTGNSRLIAVCSRTMDKAQALAKANGALRAYDSYEKMLADPELNAVYIATPNNLHAEQTRLAALAHKHVLCEKPMALTVKEAQGMVDVCKANGVKLGMDFQNRFHPAHVEIRRLVKAGEIGDVYAARVQYCHGRLDAPFVGWRANLEVAGAGSLFGTGLHPIDLARFVLDDEIAEVSATTAVATPGMSVEEMVFAIFKMRRNTSVTMITGRLVPRSDNDVILYGIKARAAGRNTVGMPLQGELEVIGDGYKTNTAYTSKEPNSGLYSRLVAAFDRAILEDTEFEVPGTNGVQMVRISDAILESAKTGRKVLIK